MRDIKDSILHKPDLITNWLNFIPKNFNEISAIYHRTSSEVVLLVNTTVFVVKIPSLTLVHAPTNIEKYFFGLPHQAKINVVFNSYLDYV